MLDAIKATQLAMEFDQLKLQSVNQNIANMNTPGFKKQVIENKGFDEQLQVHLTNVISQLDRSRINIQGTLSETHNPGDLALSGEGYFQVQNEQGIFYTRRGDFKINNQGELVTATGETVLGKSGIIRIDDNSFTVDAQGMVIVDHRKVDQLNIVQFNQSQLLTYTGNGLYQTEESPTPCASTTQVHQGFIEQSNVKSIDEMMEMIKISRHFEANQKIMHTVDKLLASAINQLGEGNV